MQKSRLLAIVIFIIFANSSFAVENITQNNYLDLLIYTQQVESRGDNFNPKTNPSDSTEADSSPEDTVSSTGGENITEYSSSSGFPISIRSLAFFTDSILPRAHSSSVFPDWNYVEIHDRKYDFCNVTDTLIIILADSLDCGYTHPVNNRVTSEFGVRKYRFHYGTDIKLDVGDPVYSAWDGVVRIAKFSRTYGNVVVVRHDNGLETLYAHLSKIYVGKDSLVHAGEAIGLGGNTGRSHGAHLHFEIRYFDEAIDPRDVIDFDNYCLKSDTLSLSAANYRYRDKIKELERVVFHTIRSGDTLSRIAVKYGTSVTAVCKLNGFSRNKILRVGQKVRVR